MSATNKTTNIELPLFIGSDVPSWLGDWNEAMTTIDSQIATAKSDAQGAASTAQDASESAAQTTQSIVTLTNQLSQISQTLGQIQDELQSSTSSLTLQPNFTGESGTAYKWGKCVIIRVVAYAATNITSSLQTTWGSYLFPIVSGKNLIPNLPASDSPMWLGGLFIPQNNLPSKICTIRGWSSGNNMVIGIESNSNNFITTNDGFIFSVPIALTGTFTGQV